MILKHNYFVYMNLVVVETSATSAENMMYSILGVQAKRKINYQNPINEVKTRGNIL